MKWVRGLMKIRTQLRRPKKAPLRFAFTWHDFGIFTLVAKLIKILHTLKIIFYLQNECFVVDNLYLYLVFVDVERNDT